jgi:hypothetical protein
VHTGVFQEPTIQQVSDLDILFIVDTSDSMDITRKVVAQQIGKFITLLQVPSGGEVHIGVIAAHGPDSSKRLMGTLFVEGRDDSPVLSTGSMSKAQIQKLLVRKMVALQKYRDDSDAQGEMGLMNLYRSLTDSRYYDPLVAQGLFRPNAALMVVFMSDEQDVCYDYKPGEIPQWACQPEDFARHLPNCSWVGGQNPNNPKDPIDPHEVHTKQAYCHIDEYNANSPILQPTDVWKAVLSKHGSEPNIIAGIHYLSNDTIPASDRKDRWGAEHEEGHGYIDLIKLDHGAVVDLADHDRIAGRVLGLASVARYKMFNYQSSFTVSSADANILNPATAQITVTNPGSSRSIPIPPEMVQYVAPNFIVDENEIRRVVKPGATIEIQYQIGN